MEKTFNFVLLMTISAVYSIKYDGLRVKFGYSDALAGTEYFFDFPRTISELDDGFVRTEPPLGTLEGLKLYCPPGRVVCLLFDTAGFVAGIQINIPIYAYNGPPVSVFDPEKKFVKWYAPAVVGETTLDYWSATQYFVSEESLLNGAGPTIKNRETLQDGGVWVAGLDGRLMRVPCTEAELNTTDFKKQNCFPNMGTHYYYNMTKNMKCENFLPWFALITDGDLVGTGFQVFGRIQKMRHGNWFEESDSYIAKRDTEFRVPKAPPCMQEWAEKYGLLTLHIYYVNEPWNIKCKAGDSIQPVSVGDRLLINAKRFYKKISDEVVKLSSG